MQQVEGVFSIRCGRDKKVLEAVLPEKVKVDVVLTQRSTTALVRALFPELGSGVRLPLILVACLLVGVDAVERVLGQDGRVHNAKVDAALECCVLEGVRWYMRSYEGEEMNRLLGLPGGREGVTRVEGRRKAGEGSAMVVIPVGKAGAEEDAANAGGEGSGEDACARGGRDMDGGGAGGGGVKRGGHARGGGGRGRSKVGGGDEECGGS